MAPALTFDITGAKNQKPVGPQVAPANHKAKNNRGKILSVKVTCQNSPCTVDLKGNATASGQKVKFDAPQISLQSGETKKVRLSASGKQPLAALKGALKAGANGKAKVHGTATAPNGEMVQRRLQREAEGPIAPSALKPRADGPPGPFGVRALAGQAWTRHGRRGALATIPRRPKGRLLMPAARFLGLQGLLDL